MNTPKRIENFGAPINLASKFKPGDIVLITHEYLEEDNPNKYYIGTISNPISPTAYRIGVTHRRTSNELEWARYTESRISQSSFKESQLTLIEDFTTHEAFNAPEKPTIAPFTIGRG